MTRNEQTAVEAIKHHLWTYRTGGLSRDTFLSFMEKEIDLLESSPTVPVSTDLRKLWESGVHHGYGHAMRAAIPRDRARDSEAFDEAVRTIGMKQLEGAERTQFNPFPVFVRLTRAHIGMTIREMAQEIGIDHVRLSELETDHGDSPTDEEVRTYAKNLGALFTRMAPQ